MSQLPKLQKNVADDDGFDNRQTSSKGKGRASAGPSFVPPRHSAPRAESYNSREPRFPSKSTKRGDDEDVSITLPSRPLPPFKPPFPKDSPRAALPGDGNPILGRRAASDGSPYPPAKRPRRSDEGAESEFGYGKKQYDGPILRKGPIVLAGGDDSTVDYNANRSPRQASPRGAPATRGGLSSSSSDPFSPGSSRSPAPRKLPGMLGDGSVGFGSSGRRVSAGGKFKTPFRKGFDPLKNIINPRRALSPSSGQENDLSSPQGVGDMSPEVEDAEPADASALEAQSQAAADLDDGLLSLCPFASRSPLISTSHR